MENLGNKRAFTLVELLIVIAVIAILASLFLAAISKAKCAAWRANCTSNLHQIGIAARVYLDSYSAYPPFGPNENYHREGFWDFNLLIAIGTAPSAITNAAKVFFCPSTPPVTTNGAGFAVSWPEANWTWQDAFNTITCNRSYGYNGSGTSSDPEDTPYLGLGAQWLYTSGPPLPESAIAVPSDMAFCADYSPEATDDDNDGDLHPHLAYLGLARRHAEGANVLFCDGHLEYGKLAQWKALTNEARRRWNHDHQPHWP